MPNEIDINVIKQPKRIWNSNKEELTRYIQDPAQLATLTEAEKLELCRYAFHLELSAREAAAPCGPTQLAIVRHAA